MNFIKRSLRSEGFLSGILIVVMAALAYLPLITRLTYYGDDWHIAWGGHTFGYLKVANIYSTDRPFMGIVYALNYLMLGDRPLNWQLYAVLQRVIGGLAFFWIVRMLWPQQKRATTLMAVLLTVYPGFLLMPNASTYQTLLFGINLGLLSIACTLRFLFSPHRGEKIGMAILAGLLAMGSVFMFEWFISLEVLRVALIWHMLERQHKLRLWPKVRAATLCWLPAVVGVGIFLFWRIFFFTNLRHATSFGVVLGKYLQDPSLMFLRIPAETLRSIGETVLSAWLVPLYSLLTSSTQHYTLVLMTAFIGAMSVVLLIGGQLWLDRRAGQPLTQGVPQIDHWELHAILIGALNVFTALLMVVILDRGVSLNGDTYDRYTLTSMPGVALMLVGTLFLAIKSQRGQIGAVAVFVGLAVMTHFANASKYSDIAVMQRQFWWQLAWRAPDLKTGTMLMPSLQPYDFTADYDIFPEANLIYRPMVREVQIGAEVLNRNTVFLVTSGTSDISYMRTIIFARDFRNVLAAAYGYTTGQSTCMHLIDGNAIELSLYEDPYVSMVAPYSKIDRVDVNAQPHIPPEIFFGPEPPHTWCYYYEKASLARQKGDWQEVVRLGNEAASLGYRPTDLIEWMPFLEAYANLGQTQEVHIIAAAIRSDQDIQRLLCQRFGPNAPLPSTYYTPQAFALIATAMCQ